VTENIFIMNKEIKIKVYMDKITWNTEKRLVKDLKPYKNNPRQISKHQLEHLRKSLEKFDYCEIIAIQPDNTIIAGHMRIKAMQGLGWKNREIEVRVPSRQLTEEEMREYLIRSNKNTGDWDWDVLANEWDIIDLFECGFTQEDLGFLKEELNAEEKEEPDNEILEPTKNPKTKLGDRYVLGNCVLVCGDSTDPNCVRDCLRDQVPILMVTDPPYGVNYDASWRKDIKGKLGVACRATGKVQNDDQIDWSEAWKLFPGSVSYVWHASLHTYDVYKSLIDSDFSIISNIIWAKQHFSLSRGDYHWQHEPCWYAVKKGKNHNWQGSRKESTLWQVSNLNAFGTNKEDERTAHSTQKPIECMSRPIRNNTAFAEGVYDPFLGSGTTLLACEQLDRRCYGIELDPAYCDITVERWVKYRKKIGKDPAVIKNGNKCEDFNGS
jgi:DNA modification methylase